MRAPTEKDRAQAWLDRMVTSFMIDDWQSYQEAATWLRDYVDRKRFKTGRQRRGNRWFTTEGIEGLKRRVANIRRRKRC